MIKKIFILEVLLVLIIPTYVPSAEKKITSKRPNILFAIADDWGWPHASSYGDPVVKTPVFARVAKEGLLFNHAYISSPSCTPSRNALLSGQYHWRLGDGANLRSNFDPKTPVYPLLLQASGYHVGSWRKSYGPGSLKGWTDYPAGKVYKKGFKEFLSEKKDGQPFCFFLGTSDPHRRYKPDSGEKSGMDLSKIKLFEHFPDNKTIRGDVADYYYEVQRFDRDVGRALTLLEERGELENTIVVITGDHGMPFPRCKGHLYDAGARVPLAIRYGAQIKKAGRAVDDFVSLTDLAPTFLELAGVAVPKVMTGKTLLPLLENKKSAQQRSSVIFGRERHTAAQEGHNGGYPSRALRNHDYLYIHNFEPSRWPAGTPNYKKSFVPGAWLADCDNGPTKTYMVKNKMRDAQHTKLWNLSFAKRPQEELYDCRKDPGQLVNLADDPKFKEIKKQMAEKLMSQLKSSEDPRAFGKGQFFDTFPYRGGTPKHPSYEEK